MSVGSLYYDQITCLDALTRSVLEYSLTGILEANFEVILILLLIHACKPVIYLKLAAALTVGAVQLSCLCTFYDTAA
jgi:hypothetical protein